MIMKFDRSLHRLQFNIDANVWMYKYRPQSAFYRPYGVPLTVQDIHRNVDILADSGIDTLTVNAHSTQFAYYPSKHVPTAIDGYRRGDREYFRGHAICATACRCRRASTWRTARRSIRRPRCGRTT